MTTTSGSPAPAPRSSSSREAASRAADRAYHNHVSAVQSNDGAPRFWAQHLASRCSVRETTVHRTNRYAKPVWSSGMTDFLNLPRPIVAHAVCIAAFSVRHCVLVIAESCDSLDRMDEFLVGVVYSKQGCNLVSHYCPRLLGFACRTG